MDASAGNVFDLIADSIKPEDACAMLLLQESSRRLSWRWALDLLKQLASEPLDCEVVNEDYPAVVIFRMSPKDIPAAVLRLTEKGYTRFKAIDPKIRP
jgi:hypothetical protein